MIRIPPTICKNCIYNAWSVELLCAVHPSGPWTKNYCSDFAANTPLRDFRTKFEIETQNELLKQLKQLGFKTQKGSRRGFSNVEFPQGWSLLFDGTSSSLSLFDDKERKRANIHEHDSGNGLFSIDLLKLRYMLRGNLNQDGFYYHIFDSSSNDAIVYEDTITLARLRSDPSLLGVVFEDNFYWDTQYILKKISFHEKRGTIIFTKYGKSNLGEAISVEEYFTYSSFDQDDLLVAINDLISKKLDDMEKVSGFKFDVQHDKSFNSFAHENKLTVGRFLIKYRFGLLAYLLIIGRLIVISWIYGVYGNPSLVQTFESTKSYTDFAFMCILLAVIYGCIYHTDWSTCP
jgi:hypothetical protein